MKTNRLNIKQTFFNESLKLFKKYKIQNKTILVAVSGGLDSVVLLDLLNELKTVCKLKLYTAHIHHGPSSHKTIKNYRDKAQLFTNKLSAHYKLPFLGLKLSKKEFEKYFIRKALILRQKEQALKKVGQKNVISSSQYILQSEKEFRDFRLFYLEKLAKQKKAHILALAHNKNDLLETRLIQLIRGCGEEGLKSMQVWQSQKTSKNKTQKDFIPRLRPLLLWSRKDIQAYAQQRKLKWLEDPSNKSHQALRNWIRNKWLVDLENKRKGAVKSLHRSLEALSLSSNKDFNPKIITAQGLKRDLFMEMTLADQKRVLAFYMRKLKLSNYGQSHIQEILKLAEKKEKKFSVKILKKTWTFTKSYISAS